MKRVAIVGTQGVPAKYGGFETLVENIIGENCSREVEYTFFCSGKDFVDRQDRYKGAFLKYIPFHANGIQSIPYDIVSLIRCVWRYDVVVVLGVSGCIFLPLFRLLYWKKLIVNIDGLEHRREKWKKWVRSFLRLSEAMAVRFADTVIADNKGIKEYVQITYHKEAALIAYGGDHVLRVLSREREKEILARYHLIPYEYAVSICRVEPENNCHITLRAFLQAGRELVFVGNWERNSYGKELKELYQPVVNIRMLNAIYDLDILYVLRKYACCYIHGHSAGGTNPSLVEAMFFGRPVLAYDVIYNRETTGNKAYYFKDSTELCNLLSEPLSSGAEMCSMANTYYKWAIIAHQYEVLY